MSSLQGYLYASYKTIQKKLGKPYIDYDEKTQREWGKAVDGIDFSIYDYRSSRHYTKIKEWHIGSDNQDCLIVVKKLFPNCKVKSDETGKLIEIGG